MRHLFTFLFASLFVALVGCQSHIVSERNFVRLEDGVSTLAAGHNSGSGLSAGQCGDLADNMGDALDKSPTIAAHGKEIVQTGAGLLPAPWGDLLSVGAAIAASAYAVKKHRQASAGIAVVKAIDMVKKSANGGEGKVDFKDPNTVALLNSGMGDAGKKFVDAVQTV